MSRIMENRLVRAGLALVCTLTMCVAGLVASNYGSQAAVAQTMAGSEVGRRNPNHELTVSYYRTWRDTHSDPVVNKNAMTDLPPAVDIAIVFPDDVETKPVYWDSVPGQIAVLHRQGTKVIRSLDIRVFYKDHFQQGSQEDKALTPMESTAAGYAKRAQEIRDGLLNYAGMDGLVINSETPLSAADVTRATGVIQAISQYYGPQSSQPDSILAYNTNVPGTAQLFQNIHSLVSYVFADAYGRNVAALQKDWESYKGLISSRQYIPGFSFYEERGEHWLDTQAPIETSRAAAYARWEPDGGAARKGGLFGYAVDRDGVPDGQDALVRTDFSWTKALARMMNPTES